MLVLINLSLEDLNDRQAGAAGTAGHPEAVEELG
jgi:hypothetical protein